MLSFLVQINKSFFWNLRFYVRFYYICVEMHWNRTLKHLILITFVFKTSLNDYFDVMHIFICHWRKIDFFSWILFSLQNNPIKCQIIDKELKIYCCHTVHFPFEIQNFSVHVLTQQLYNISHYCNDVYIIYIPPSIKPRYESINKIHWAIKICHLTTKNLYSVKMQWSELNLNISKKNKKLQIKITAASCITEY